MCVSNWRVGLILALIAIVIGNSGVKAAGKPTGQPTGLPTSMPTSTPTAVYRPLISFNVTLLLHEVDPDDFNLDFDNCMNSVRSTLSQAVAVKLYGVVANQDSVSLYENQVYDYNFVDAIYNEEFENGTDPVLLNYLPTKGRRKLGRTHGSRGVTLYLTFNADPNAMGFNVDNDAAYFAIVDELKDLIKTHSLTGFLRDQSYLAGCVPVSLVEGITPAYISNSYESMILNQASPTPSPTNHVVKRMRNRAGVIAGVLLAATAFLIAVAVVVHIKCMPEFNAFFGFDGSASAAVDEEKALEYPRTVEGGIAV